MNSSNPNYLGHMDSLPTTMSIIADIISSSLNNNMLSKETAPILTEIENSVTESFAKKFRLGNQSGGVMLSGGSLSNLQAIGIARNRFFGSSEKGVVGLKRQPYIFASEYCHTSILKAAMILGGYCGNIEYTCASDLNDDLNYNVLDIVQLANCVLAQNCGG